MDSSKLCASKRLVRNLFLIEYQCCIGYQDDFVEAGEIVNFTISLRIIRKLIMILRLPVTFNKNINNEIVRPMEIRQ
tara:strand:+ start:86 stop:316 length:231 start_codon:yes stop_codon:yes gene_type:complete